MPELRQDPVTLRWVSIATERSRRPTSFSRADSRTDRSAAAPTAQCPFCEGHEAMTPPETSADREPGSAPDSPGWSFRVVPNLYPAFGPADGDTSSHIVGPYLAMPGVGVHEVLIDGPDHFADVADHDVPKVAQIVRGFVARYLAAAENPHVEYVLLILNHGREAGASLEHPHSQLFGIPLVPEAVEREIEGVERRLRERGLCPYCEMISYEAASGDRVIFENDGFLVVAPFASRVPFETWIVPKAHRSRFEAMGDNEQVAFADALHSLACRLKRGLKDPPYNLFIHTTPTRRAGDAYHWHAELLPKLTIAAGFELGTDVYVNVVTPESAAEFLRGVGADEAATGGSSPSAHG